MPHRIESPIRTQPFDILPRVRWTVEKYECLFNADILSGHGYELIEGDIVEKMPVKYPHARIIMLLSVLFGRFLDPALLLSQFSLYIDDESMPEPDFVVLHTENPHLTERGYVKASEIRLLIEVSDATLSNDLNNKAVLYARAAIGEYWVVDVTGRRLFIHTEPGQDGYHYIVEYGETETASPNFDPNISFAVAAILPTENQT